MGHASIRQQLLYKAESAWCEAWATPDVRLQLLAPIDTSGLERKYHRMEPTRNYLCGGMLHRRLPFLDAEFTFEVEAGGHGTAPTGALTPTQLYTLLTYAIGNGDATSVGTTCDGTGSAIAPGVAGGTFPAGAVCRIGNADPRDGRGSGEACAVSGLAGGVLTNFNTLADTPNNNDVVYAMLQLFPEILVSDIATSLRFLVLGPDYAYRCRGCFITKVELVGLTTGELPRWRITVGVSDVDIASDSFPDATATAAKSAAPIHGSTLYIQTVGTATRAIYSPRQLSFTIEMDVQPAFGGESDVDVAITGAYRKHIGAYWDIMLDKDAAGTDLWATWWNASEESQVYKRVIATLGRVPGRCMAISTPRTKPAHDWNRPTIRDLDGINRVLVRLECEPSLVTTNDLTLAPFVIGIG